MKTTIFVSFFLLILTANTKQNFSQWQQTSLNTGNIISLSVTGNHIFAANTSQVFYSTNDGTDWENTGINTYIWDMAASGNNVYVATHYLNFYRSTNLGLNWQQITGAADGVRSVAADENMVFAGFQNYGTIRSTNSGESWGVLQNISGTITSFFIDGNIVYAGQQNILRSTDAGITWFTAALNTDFIDQFAKSGNNFFAASVSKGVYISTNNGINWEQTALTNTRVTSVVVSGSNIIAGTTNSGVQLSTDNGNNWQQFNSGLPVLSISSLTIKDNFLYAGTFSAGVWKRDISELLAIHNISSEIPADYNLSQNYPNPFNPSTKIRFSLPKSGFTELNIYDINGKLVQNVLSSELNADIYETDFNASNLASGIYYYTLTTGDYSATKKMVLVK